jgi:hypothetical protein
MIVYGLKHWTGEQGAARIIEMDDRLAARSIGAKVWDVKECFRGAFRR